MFAEELGGFKEETEEDEEEWLGAVEEADEKAVETRSWRDKSTTTDEEEELTDDVDVGPSALGELSRGTEVGEETDTEGEEFEVAAEEEEAVAEADDNTDVSES